MESQGIHPKSIKNAINQYIFNVENGITGIAATIKIPPIRGV